MMTRGGSAVVPPYGYGACEWGMRAAVRRRADVAAGYLCMSTSSTLMSLGDTPGMRLA